MSIALVLGGARNVWTDVEAALALSPFDAVVTCNDVTAEWPGRIDAMATLHAEKAGIWIERRRRRGYPDPERVIGHEAAKAYRRTPAVVTGFTSLYLPGQKDSGSSGLFAVKVALDDLGFDKAVCCGVPMTPGEKHFFDSTAWAGAQAHRKGWNQALPAIKDRVRSMSGWTADLLGRPDKEWLGA